MAFCRKTSKNKINNLIDLNPTLMHSLDSLDLAQELNKKLEAKENYVLLTSNKLCKRGY